MKKVEGEFVEWSESGIKWSEIDYEWSETKHNWAKTPFKWSQKNKRCNSTGKVVSNSHYFSICETYLS